MFTFKNLRIVLLSVFISLMVCAIAITPALADGGDSETTALESPDAETDPDSSYVDPALSTDEQNDGGTLIDEDGQEAETPPSGGEADEAPAADGDPPTGETEVLPEADADAPEGESEEVPEADAIPPEGESEEVIDESLIPPTPESTEAIEDPAAQEDPILEGEAALAEEPLGEEPVSDDPAPLADGEVSEAQDESITIILDTDASGDPIWCPAAVGTPLDGAAGCTSSYSSLQSLLTYLTANQPSVDGVIWIEKDYDSSVNDVGMTDFTLDGSILSTMADYAITIRGGWDGLGTKSIDTSDPSVFHVGIGVVDWNNDITISDIEITGASSWNGLVIEGTEHEVNLTRVRANSNANIGTYINNTPGTADVNVVESEFNDNTGETGLIIFSKGKVTLKDVSASGNGEDGVYVDNGGGVPGGVVMTSGTYNFNDNGSDGLVIHSKGTVSLKDITAVGNTGYGAYIENMASDSAGITLSGTNFLSENGSGGLMMYSHGAIKASNIIANANSGGMGAYLDNSSAAFPKPVTLTGSNQFKFNEGGLIIYSLGNITLSNVSASNNTNGDGAYLYNGNPGANGNVTLSGVNTFNNNSQSGLTVYSYGTIKGSSLEAIGNGWGGFGNGAYLYNAGAASVQAVTLTGINTFDYNYDGGLYVYATGPITASKVSASGNMGGTGIHLQNSILGNTKPQSVKLTSYVIANMNDGSGLQVFSYGAIDISNLQANDNGQGGGGHGAYLDSWLGDASIVQPIILSGTNDLNDNAGYGLYATGLGPITVNNLHTDRNLDTGAYLNNDLSYSSGHIKVNGISSFNDNGDTGLSVFSVEGIYIQNLDAIGNGGYGAYLYNSSLGQSGGVRIGTSMRHWCNAFWDNASTGLYITSNGIVTLSNICADGNGYSSSGFGVYVNNSTAVTLKPVVLKGENRFNSNNSGGLHVMSNGVIKASNLEANDNGGNGVYLDNGVDPNTPQLIQLTGWNSFFGNSNNGLEVYSYGQITTSNISAGWNGNFGTILDNYLGTAVKPIPVTLKGSNWFEGNGSSGLTVYSLGAIKGNNIGSYSNGGFGAYLSNSYTGAVGAVNILGISEFSYNGDSGLEIWSRGSILIKDIDAYENDSFGVYLYNAISGTSGNVTLGTNRANWCNGFSENYYSGLEILSNGYITLSNICADGNGDAISTYGYGVYAQNSTAASPKKVVLKGTNRFNNNYTGGLEVATLGMVTASNLSAGGNEGHGVAIYNNADPASQQNVNITGRNSFWWNSDNGLVVYSYGSIQVSNIEASGNGGVGAWLDNYGGVSIAPRTLTLIGTNTFEGNGSDGLIAVSWGQIKGSNLTARWNGNLGAYLDNQWGAGSVGGILLKGTNTFDGNAAEGLVGYSHGAIVISTLSANWNGSTGAWLETWGLSAPQKVTLKGTNTFIGNGDFGTHSGDGLWIRADGQININNLTASYNAENGAVLDNYSYWWTGTPGITLTGTNAFNENYVDGLYFDSMGPVTLYKVTADGNSTGSGVYGYSNDKITIFTGSMTSNAAYGWYLWTPGVATLKGVYAYGNLINGYLDGGGTLILLRS